MLDVAPDLRVLGATVGFCVLSTAISGLGPAWRVTRPDVLPDLKEQPAQEKAGRGLTMRNALVVGQIALSLTLLTTAGLFMRGAVKAAVADPGFPLDGGVIVNVDAGMAGYDEARGRERARALSCSACEKRRVCSRPASHRSCRSASSTNRGRCRRPEHHRPPPVSAMRDLRRS